MSRARWIEIDGERHWFDTNQDGQLASGEQLELLAAAENIEIDDLLDADLTQGQIILRIREALDGPVIPHEILERKRVRRAQAQQRPACRICGCEGKSTRHHFVPRWVMRELENYNSYSARSMCTIPLCVECHRDIHRRDDRPGKSIVPFLLPHEAELAQRILTDLQAQRPKIFDLLAAGTEWTYEGVLLRDFIEGRFAKLAAGHETSVQARPLAVGSAGG